MPMNAILRFYARSLYAQGKFEETLAVYRRILRSTDSPQDRLSVSRLLLKTSRYEEAESELKKLNAINMKPVEVIQAKLNLALAQWKTGRLDEAIRRAEAIYADQKITIVYATLGYLYLEAKDLKKALAFNREAFEYNPKNTEIRDNLGQSLLESGDWQEALRLYEDLAKEKMPPLFPEWRYHYGLALSAAGRPTEAVAQLRIAQGRHFSGLSVLSKEIVQAAIDRIEASVAISSDDPA